MNSVKTRRFLSSATNLQLSSETNAIRFHKVGHVLCRPHSPSPGTTRRTVVKLRFAVLGLRGIPSACFCAMCRYYTTKSYLFALLAKLKCSYDTQIKSSIHEVAVVQQTYLNWEMFKIFTKITKTYMECSHLAALINQFK